MHAAQPAAALAALALATAALTLAAAAALAPPAAAAPAAHAAAARPPASHAAASHATYYLRRCAVGALCHPFIRSFERAAVPRARGPVHADLPRTLFTSQHHTLLLRPIAGGSPASPCTPPPMLRRHRLLILTASESHPWPLALISTACLRHLSRAVARTEPKRVRRRPEMMGTCRRASSGAGTLPWVASRRRPHTSQPPPRFPDPSIGSGEVLEEATHSYAQAPARSHTHAPRTRRPTSQATCPPCQLTCDTSCLGSGSASARTDGGPVRG